MRGKGHRAAGASSPPPPPAPGRPSPPYISVRRPPPAPAHRLQRTRVPSALALAPPLPRPSRPSWPWVWVQCARAALPLRVRHCGGAPHQHGQRARPPRPGAAHLHHVARPRGNRRCVCACVWQQCGGFFLCGVGAGVGGPCSTSNPPPPGKPCTNTNLLRAAPRTLYVCPPLLCASSVPPLQASRALWRAPAAPARTTARC